MRDKVGYAYTRFPPSSYELLSGIGVAKPGVPGWGAGVTFYLRTDNLAETRQRVTDHGGTVVVTPVEADGYHFAMFEDPETNLVGLLEPFPEVPPRAE